MPAEAYYNKRNRKLCIEKLVMGVMGVGKEESFEYHKNFKIIKNLS